MDASQRDTIVACPTTTQCESAQYKSAQRDSPRRGSGAGALERHAVSRRRLAAVAALLLIGGCTPGRDLPPVDDPSAAAYRFGTGDVIRITTFGQPDLTGEFRVSDAGSIAFPLLGPVPVAGATGEQVAQRISEDLRRRRLLNDANVVVEVLSYRPVFILGEVNKPGEYPYRPGMTMLTAVAVAGGFTYRAVTGYGSVVRLTPDGVIEGKLTRRSRIEPGDTITIFERRL